MPPKEHSRTPPGATPNLGALYLQHSERLVRVAASVLLWNFNLRDGEVDVVQQVFLELHENPPREPVNNWEAFLVQRTRNRAIDHGRKQHVRKWGGSVDDDDFDPVDPSSGSDLAEVERLIDTELQMRVVRAAIAELDEREQIVIRQVMLGGATRDEVAASLDVSGPRISQIQKAALEKIRARIQKDLST